MIYIINEIREIFNIKKYKTVRKVTPKKDNEKPNLDKESELTAKGKIIDIRI